MVLYQEYVAHQACRVCYQGAEAVLVLWDGVDEKQEEECGSNDACEELVGREDTRRVTDGEVEEVPSCDHKAFLANHENEEDPSSHLNEVVALVLELLVVVDGRRRTSNHGEEVARQNFLLGASCPFHVEMEEGRDRRCRAGCLVVDGCHRVMENHRASIHHDVAAEVRHVASPYDCYRMTCWIRYQNCAITINGTLSSASSGVVKFNTSRPSCFVSNSSVFVWLIVSSTQTTSNTTNGTTDIQNYSTPSESF